MPHHAVVPCYISARHPQILDRRRRCCRCCCSLGHSNCYKYQPQSCDHAQYCVVERWFHHHYYYHGDFVAVDDVSNCDYCCIEEVNVAIEELLAYPSHASFSPVFVV